MVLPGMTVSRERAQSAKSVMPAHLAWHSLGKNSCWSAEHTGVKGFRKQGNSHLSHDPWVGGSVPPHLASQALLYVTPVRDRYFT